MNTGAPLLGNMRNARFLQRRKEKGAFIVFRVGGGRVGVNDQNPGNWESHLSQNVGFLALQNLLAYLSAESNESLRCLPSYQHNATIPLTENRPHDLHPYHSLLEFSST